MVEASASKPTNKPVYSPELASLQAKLADGTCFLDCPPRTSIECGTDPHDYAQPICPVRRRIAELSRTLQQ